MPDKNNDYVQQRARDLTQRLRAAQLELPEFCTDYFRAIGL